MRSGWSRLGLGMLLGLTVLSAWSAEPDPAEIKRRMEIYMRDDPAEKPVPVIDYDHEAWKAATECGKAACFRAYLEDYPKGRYAKIARARLEPESKPESRPPAVTERPTPAVRSKQRFTDNSDGTVTDNKSGLIWLKDANCFGYKDWSTAIDLAKRLKNGQCDLHDRSVAGQWRLPSKEEWEALIDRKARNPALPSGHPFTGVRSSYYWSSTPSKDNASFVWIVGLNGGHVDTFGQTLTYYVWPVRDGR